MGDVHHCSRAPVFEMTYTVSSGTLNSTIPYQHLTFYRPDATPVAEPTVSEHVRMRLYANVAGNTYSIENLRNDEAKLIFTQIKG